MSKYVFLQEITEWEYPNHIYIFADKKSSKCIGYIPNDGKTIFMFEKPLSFDKKKRKFVEVDPQIAS